jgi:D-alanyl-D-alanine carboxypeptidase (penicillin-binding protein 5/6)
LTVPALALDDPDPRCGAAIIVDGDYNEVLYSKNGYERMYPASITKIMTSLVVMDALERGEVTLDTPVTASATAISSIPADASNAGIKPGEIMTLEQLLYCDMVSSACEACNILAEAVAGSIEEFVVRMNEKAAELGMKDSHFVNAHGLHDPNHYTTAYDISIMAREAMKNELFRTIVSTTKYVIPATNMHKERTLRTTNSLIDNWRVAGYTYDKAIGIKTGFTTPAGRCLASAAVDSDGRTFYCIVLGAENVKEEDGTVTYYQFIEPKRLLEWAFDSFERITLMDENLVLREVPVTLADSDHVLVKPVGSVEKTMPVDYDPNKAEIIVDLPESVEAPVQANTVMGTVTLVYEGEELGTLDLVTQNDVPRSETKYYMKLVEETITTWWFKAIVVGVVLFILVLIILIVVLRGRSRRNRYSYSSRRRRY